MVGPMSTILMGVLLLGEPFTAWIAAGTVLVIAGIFVFSGRAPRLSAAGALRIMPGHRSRRTSTWIWASQANGRWCAAPARAWASAARRRWCARACNVVIVARGAEALEAAAAAPDGRPRRAAGARRSQHVAADITTAEGRAAVFAVRKRLRHRRHQRRRPAARRLPRLGPRGLDQGGGRQHAHADRADQGHGGRHGGARLRPHRQHHLERGEGADRHPGPVQRRAQRPDRLRRRRGAHAASWPRRT